MVGFSRVTETDDTAKAAFEIEIIGEQRKATIITEPLFDPAGAKMRS